MGLPTNGHSPLVRRSFITLAPGVCVTRRRVQPHAMLQSAVGGAHLNEPAAAILELCDGSRTRDQLIVEAVLQSSGVLRTSDVVAFLNATQARGWVVESP
jgi:hypothetical protein